MTVFINSQFRFILPTIMVFAKFHLSWTCVTYLAGYQLRRPICISCTLNEQYKRHFVNHSHPLLYQLICNFTIAVFSLLVFASISFLHLVGSSSQLPQASVFYSTLSGSLQLLFLAQKYATCTLLTPV